MYIGVISSRYENSKFFEKISNKLYLIRKKPDNQVKINIIESSGSPDDLYPNLALCDSIYITLEIDMLSPTDSGFLIPTQSQRWHCYEKRVQALMSLLNSALGDKLFKRTSLR